MSTQYAALSSILKKHAQGTQAQAPRRKAYEMSTETRIVAINSGKTVTIPKMTTALAVTNVMTVLRTALGRFPSPESAALFAISGCVRYQVTADEVIAIAESRPRAGYFRLNEGELRHLLSANRLIFNREGSRESFEITMSQIERDGDFEVEIEGPGILKIAEGRKFR